MNMPHIPLTLTADEMNAHHVLIQKSRFAAETLFGKDTEIAGLLLDLESHVLSAAETLEKLEWLDGVGLKSDGGVAAKKGKERKESGKQF